MMLSKEIFTKVWAVLLDRFNADKSTLTAQMYYDSLQAELTDEQFKRGCAVVFKVNRFFPSPLEIIEGGLGAHDAEALALRRWALAIEANHRNQASPLTIEEKRMLMQASNGQPLHEIPGKELPWIQKAFVALYHAESVDRARKALPSLDAEPKGLPGYDLD